jgi:hypothetical protein
VYIGLVLDCHDPTALAPCWAEALRNLNLGGVDNYVLLAPDGCCGPNLFLQKVPEGKEEARVLTSVTEDLGPLLTEDGVRIGAAAWLVTAQRP